jgi:hypothetical protein
METGTIYLPTASAVALFKNELLGQMSDGMWENSRPFLHYEFWYHLNVVHESGCTPRVKTECAWQCKKNAYNFVALIPIVGERMLSIGRNVNGEWGYTEQMLRADLKSIKAAMKTVNIR